ncbi:recombinase family protein [Flavobacterium sp.]|uniref:recombinase family protein n=1 Tax=Flavobacterium sp. TaxID=239 RepID=UPI003D6B4B78
MSLDRFKVFQKEKTIEVAKTKKIWGYTRVSSKEQYTNFSLDEQRNEITEFALKNNYVLEQIVGGTYESASGDLTRKEFNRLMDEVKKSKNRPFAIAIKFINRFSRTGGNAIGIVQELIEKMGVHLIETSSGLSTENELDKLEVYRKLLEAKKENLERLQKTLPGMRALLASGGWLGKPPRGYELRGRKVSDFSRMQAKQEILITEDGKHLINAWKWKLAGERDYLIRQRLMNLGVNITKQVLSDMWRRPFYCGVSVNALLDEPRKGNWEAMVSEDDFWKVQIMLNENLPQNKKEFSKSKINPNRPLTGFVKCDCGCMLTGYEVKKKSLHYYKCQQCKNASFNAFTTKKSGEAGLNDLFADLLVKYSLKSELVEVFKLQLMKIFNSLNRNGVAEVTSLHSRKKEIEQKMTNLESRYINNPSFLDETYNKFKAEFKVELMENNEKLAIAELKISNHEIFINKSLNVLENMSKCWRNGDVENKIRIQNLVFPDGLSIKPKSREYLTKKVNVVFALIPTIKGSLEGSKNEKTHQNVDGFLLVAGSIQISNQIILDYYNILAWAS